MLAAGVALDDRNTLRLLTAKWQQNVPTGLSAIGSKSTSRHEQYIRPCCTTVVYLEGLEGRQHARPERHLRQAARQPHGTITSIETGKLGPSHSPRCSGSRANGGLICAEHCAEQGLSRRERHAARARPRGGGAAAGGGQGLAAARARADAERGVRLPGRDTQPAVPSSLERLSAQECDEEHEIPSRHPSLIHRFTE